jgi:hypothetical protein
MVVEYSPFRDLLTFLDPKKAPLLVPRSGDTIRNWIDERYVAEEERLRSELALVLS